MMPAAVGLDKAGLVGITPGRIGFPQRHRLPREIADIAQRLEVIDRFEMIFQRFAANL
jgi:hypothetical protein